MTSLIKKESGNGFPGHARISGPRLQVDRRIGGVPRYAIVFGHKKDDLLMSLQVPPEIMKSVAFLSTKRGNEYQLEGTVFFVSMNYENGLAYHLYAVTARHVIEDIETDGFKKVYFRLNFSDRDADHVKSKLSDWWFHPGDTFVDVAVLPVKLPERSDHMNLPTSFFITPEVASSKGMTIGDEIFYTGLFSPRPGGKKNIPIVRLGNIAAMPNLSELVDTEDGPIEAYLMEARSLGGLSGSPVFAELGGLRKGEIKWEGHSPEYYLIGVAQGHWDIEKEPADVNMGIAIVTPSSKITETLNREELQAMRQEAEREHGKKNLPKKDRVASGLGISRKDFEKALKKASRRKLSSERGQGKP